MNTLESLFTWVLTTTWQASVLALLVLLAQATLGSRLNPRWRHAPWLLVVLRLLLPSLPESTLSLFQFTPPPPAALTVSVDEPLFTPAPSLAQPSISADSISEPRHPVSIYSLLALLWLSGAVGLLILTWLINHRFSRHVANSPEITDPEILQSFAKAKTELNLRRHIRLVENSRAQSPAIMGLFQPTLLLPANVREKFDARELRFIFLHELAHLKRGDILIQALIALLQIIHWFNPILWYAFRRMRIDREPATDALVLSRTGEAEKEHYGLMLLKLLGHFNQRHSLPTLVGILEDKDQFKRRFTLIARFTRSAYGWSLLGVFVLLLLAAVCLTKSKAETPTTSSEGVTSPKSVRVSLQVIQLGEEDYRPHQAAIDAAVARGDASFFSQFKSSNTVSKLVILTKPGERGVMESVRVLPYAVGFGKDAAGKTVPTDWQRRDLGTRMVLWPQVDHGKITFDAELQVTSLSCWVETTKAKPEPAFNVMGASVRAETFTPNETKGFSFTGGAHDQPLDPSQAFGPDKNIAALPHQFGRMFYFIQASLADPVAWVNPASTAAVSAGPATRIQTLDAAAVQKLIDQGADLNKVQFQGQPLIFAADSPEVAELLLQHGANANARNQQQDAVINCTCRNGGKHAAAVVRVLLAHGADPNTRCGDLGDTPAMDARDAATIDLLVAHGADVNAKTTDGMPGYVLARDKPLEYFTALLRNGLHFNPKVDGPTLLSQAAWVANLPVMTYLLDQGVDPNAEGVWAMASNGKPDLAKPLENAVVSGQLPAVKLLLARGAKSDDYTLIALQNRHFDTVKFLWEAGVREISPLCYAVSQGAPVGEIQKLLDAGSPADPPQDKTITPLGVAAGMGNPDVVKLLIARHADINAGGMLTPHAPKYWRRTPLILASAEGQDEVVAFLLQNGASPDPSALYQACFNSTPYSNQRSKDHFEKTVRILIDAGALRKISPETAGLVLAGPLGTRQGPPNLTVLKMLLDAGLSPELPMPYLAENGEKPNTVIGDIRDYYQKNKESPSLGSWAAQFKPVLDLLEAADKPAPGRNSAAPANIRIALWLVEVDDRQYQADKKRMDAAAERGDFAFFNNLEHISTLSTPTVTTTPGLKASIEIVREFPYPTEFESAKVLPYQTVSTAGGSMSNMTLMVPPTPREFVTKDVGVSAEITPTINPADSPAPGKIEILGRVSLTDFEGFTASNVDGGPNMPNFTTSESHFFEQVGDNELKGIWLPGLHASEPPPADKNAPPYASSIPRAQVKRLLLFVSATRAP